MELLIKNVNIIDAKQSICGNVLIKNGSIKEIYKEDKPMNEEIEVIDGKGMALLPSFIDMHTHLRYPGFTYKEDLETGQNAALKGGYTHICAMANTKPACDNVNTVKHVLDEVEKMNLLDVYQIGAVTEELKGEKITNIKELRRYTKLFSDDGMTIFNDEIMGKALKLSNELDFTILTHCQPEFEIVERDLKLLKKIGGNLHICHISLKETAKIVREFKDNGHKFTCEVTPHHIFGNDLKYKVNPSFRKLEDVKSLIQAIKDGYIDVIGTDHAPHSKEDKEKGAPGISNIEVAFSMICKAFENNNISLNKLSEMMSYNPANILKLENVGLIKKDYEANLVLVDLKEEYKIDVSKFVSKGKNNPFDGEMVKGRIKMTIKKGEIKYDNR